MSFLEMLDVVNEELAHKGEEPIAFDHDCREGICGMCGFMINGVAHGPARSTTTCQLHMRSFKDGDEITIEPWRAAAFPVVRDLIVDRSAFDRVIQAEAMFRCARAQRQKRTRCPSRSRIRTSRSRLPRASVAVRASRHARTHRPRSSLPPKSRTLRSYLKGTPSASTASAKWSRRWTPKASATAPVTKSAKPPALKTSNISFIAKMNRELLTAMTVAPSDVKSREKA